MPSRVGIRCSVAHVAIKNHVHATARPETPASPHQPRENWKGLIIIQQEHKANETAKRHTMPMVKDADLWVRALDTQDTERCAGENLPACKYRASERHRASKVPHVSGNHLLSSVRHSGILLNGEITRARGDDSVTTQMSCKLPVIARTFAEKAMKARRTTQDHLIETDCSSETANKSQHKKTDHNSPRTSTSPQPAPQQPLNLTSSPQQRHNATQRNKPHQHTALPSQCTKHQQANTELACNAAKPLRGTSEQHGGTHSKSIVELRHMLCLVSAMQSFRARSEISFGFPLGRENRQFQSRRRKVSMSPQATVSATA